LLFLALLVTATGLSYEAAVAQNPQRTPTETTRDFYRMMREKKYREALSISIYRPALDGLTAQEFEDLRPDFDKMAVAVAEKLPQNIDVSGEQISGDSASVFVKVLDAEGKEKIEPVTLMKIDNIWVVGSKDDLEVVKKSGKKFFFEARVNARHNDVQDLLTKILVMQVAYAQNHDGMFATLAELIAAGMIPKDLEGVESTGYRFQVFKAADGKSWYATAEPAQYGRTGRLSFYLDASGVKSGDQGGKPLVVKRN
jgi:hypothetical protein